MRLQMEGNILGKYFDESGKALCAELRVRIHEAHASSLLLWVDVPSGLLLKLRIHRLGVGLPSSFYPTTLLNL